MLDRLPKVLMFLLLALVCYGIAMKAGSGVAFAVFLIAGGLLELGFWLELFGVRKTRSDS